MIICDKCGLDTITDRAYCEDDRTICGNCSPQPTKKIEKLDRPRYCLCLECQQDRAEVVARDLVVVVDKINEIIKVLNDQKRPKTRNS